MDLLDYLTDKLVGVILLIALVPVIITQVTGANWSITLAGVTIDLTIFLLVIVILIIVGVFTFMKKRK